MGIQAIMDHEDHEEQQDFLDLKDLRGQQGIMVWTGPVDQEVPKELPGLLATTQHRPLFACTKNPLKVKITCRVRISQRQLQTVDVAVVVANGVFRTMVRNAAASVIATSLQHTTKLESTAANFNRNCPGRLCVGLAK